MSDVFLIPFDAGRAVLQDHADTRVIPDHLSVPYTERLADALMRAALTPDTRMLVFDLNQRTHAFPMETVLTYNVLHGTTDGQAWMMTFCNACNGGMVFDPSVNGRVLHFHRRGSYDGLLLIWDEETNTYWQHITGRALFGGSAGAQLTPLTTTRQMTAREVIDAHPDAHWYAPEMSADQQRHAVLMEKMNANPARMEKMIAHTIAAEDTRRPRFELGLGVWEGGRSIFFPLTLLHMNNNTLITTFNRRKMAIYQLPDAIAPVAVYTESARIEVLDDVVRLDNGAALRGKLITHADGTTEPISAPNQLLMRWYGFALTFPNCEIGQAA